MTIFDFFKICFLASVKLSRTYLYSGGSGLSIDIHFVDLEVSYDVLSPLITYCTVNHPHPYIEIATVISDRCVNFSYRIKQKIAFDNYGDI